MPAPQLPYELSDHVIDFLHDDQSSLSSCSLMCHAWLSAARYHRFSRVTVHGRLDAFAQLLEVSEGIRPYVKALLWSGGTYFRECNYAQLRAVLDRLPSLYRLHLERLVLHSEGLPELLASSAYASLTHLALVLCKLDVADDLLRTVSFLTLKHLLVDTVTCGCPPSGEDILPPSLTSLCLTGASYGTTHFFDWLTADHAAQDIRQLRIIIRDPSDVEKATYMLQTIGGTLQEFTMLVDADTNLDAVFRDHELPLDILRNIRTCHLEFDIPEMFVSSNLSLPWIASFLCQLESSALETVSLHFKADSMEDLRALDSECGVRNSSTVHFDDLVALDWAKVEEMAVKNRSLRRIVTRGRGKSEAFLEFIGSRYPSLCPLIYPAQAEV